MADPAAGEKSRESCPECGRFDLELIYFPSTDVKGVRPYDELIGMGDPPSHQTPGIGCRACGAAWADLAAFRTVQRGAEGPS